VVAAHIHHGAHTVDCGQLVAGLPLLSRVDGISERVHPGDNLLDS
jgi:hypothetical protein